MDDFRLYVNPQPKKGRASAEWQRAYLPEGEEYVEDKTGKVIDALIRSARPGTVIVVRRLFCLAPWVGETRARRRVLGERMAAIRTAGGCVMEGEGGRRSDADGQCEPMLVEAYEEIGNSRRGWNVGKRGRPGKNRPPEHLAIMKAEWLSRKNPNWQTAVEAMKAQGVLNVTPQELYRLFGGRT